MASVHPSRLGLVPGGNQPPPPPPASTREDQLKQQLLERKSRDDRNDRRNGSHDRARTENRPDVHGGSESRHGRDRDRGERQDRDHRERDEAPHRSRRASPSYQPYARDGYGNGSAPPKPPVDTGYGYGRRDDIPRGPPGPPGGEGPGPGPGGYRGWQNPPARFNGPIDFEKRRQERNNSDLSIWPPSPKEPYMDEDELAAERKKRKAKSKSKSKHSKSKKRSKRSKYSSDSDSTDSEEERRRRRRRRERERERDGRRNGDRERDRERNRDDEDDEDRERRRKRRRSRSEAEGEDDLWVEKSSKGKERERLAPIDPATKRIFLGEEEEDQDTEVGPQLPREINDKVDRSAYANMLRGEGEAMAAYAESGQRIPRRGEIGLEAEQITTFENSGYVMSGSRHQRMNAVRLRKENQVINEAEKRAILKLQREDRQQREGAIVSQFKEMMDENLKKQGGQGK
ncbi:hypothetical protein L198_03054 [Cryptococcus wingfieldii CBS 7118]|uniref:NF-kappa-B-activating protein C-terminal domain-containing protein n=1 Tax=Cryptococcus wingfieldii CBS 7118 TaxID=1295528 RepID=A0A1E3JIP9_9TREE|nr:hypothetical protein L198_03054 [Cryptococcus wingfieldii CBS 7118]ODO00728.1 hypothetical protein L198_03054 [Cryptococcus wingfieldii CBS 7118]